jgi:hypothetical protein
MQYRNKRINELEKRVANETGDKSVLTWRKLTNNK